MKFAIISAGEGSRLSQEGIRLPKPLVQLNGEAMIDRLIHIFAKNGAEQVIIIINDEVQATKDHLAKLKRNSVLPLEVVVKTTPSSMHSFYEISPFLKGEKFCLTTVDTIFREKEFTCFIEAFKKSKEDGMMAVTDYIDDEKPLYISTDDQLNITGFYDTMTPDCKYIGRNLLSGTTSDRRFTFLYGERNFSYEEFSASTDCRWAKTESLSVLENIGCRSCKRHNKSRGFFE